MAVYFVKFKTGSFLGVRLRRFVLKNEKLVKIINLNNPGDAKFIYLDPQKSEIDIEVVSVNSTDNNGNINAWMAEIIFQTTGKGTISVKPLEIEFEKQNLLTDDDLTKIRNETILHGKHDLYIVYTSSYKEKPSSVGLVLHRDTIFIFKEAIDALSDNKSTQDVLEKTTLMHEWGHLLGMDHFDDPDCIMDEKADVYDKPPLGEDLPTKYCFEEVQSLESF